MRPVERPPGPGKSGRRRGGPVVRTVGEGGGVRERASLKGEGRCNGAGLGRLWTAAWPARPRASKGAEARPVGAGRGACGPGPAFLGRESAPNPLLSPGLCPSCASSLLRLPPPCACVYSSPSRRTPADAAARTPRTGYCGRRRRSDRPFRTGFSRWLEEGRVLSQASVFQEFLESIYLNFKVLLWTESSILAQDERWRRA